MIIPGNDDINNNSRKRMLNTNERNKNYGAISILIMKATNNDNGNNFLDYMYSF